MRIGTIKRCDKCLKRKYKSIKRFYVGSQFPFYNYMGFDLCEKCEQDFNNILNKFFEVKNEQIAFMG